MTMTPEAPYANREIDEKFKDIMDSLGRIEVQTTQHNGRLTKVERILLILGTATVVLGVTNPALSKILFATIF